MFFDINNIIFIKNNDVFLDLVKMILKFGVRLDKYVR